MNQSFFLGQLRMIAVGVIAYCAGKGWLSPDALGLVSQIGTPVAAILGPWIWSIYTNLNKKIVPQDSVAIEAHAVTGGTAVGATVALSPTAKVVG